MPNSYEHSYQHDLDNVIDASDAVLAIGTEKVDTTTLKDRSLTGNDAIIYGAMPSNGYFLGRRFEDANKNYINCGNLSELNNCSYLTIHMLVRRNSHTVGHKMIFATAKDGTYISINNDIPFTSLLINTQITLSSNYTTSIDVFDLISVVYDGTHAIIYTNGVEKNRVNITGTINTGISNNFIGKYIVDNYEFDGEIVFTNVKIISDTQDEIQSFFNTIARLQLYSHNFTQYPNSDTSLTSVLPYTSGIITSGSFNKTDGLKCTSAGTIVFSNSFEFDGSEYITLVINGVEYSGTTTVTQGTITATIAQGSNDITIDMGTGDVLPDIRVQFREEV